MRRRTRECVSNRSEHEVRQNGVSIVESHTCNSVAFPRSKGIAMHQDGCLVPHLMHTSVATYVTASTRLG